jgi:hypothetical protein
MSSIKTNIQISKAITNILSIAFILKTVSVLLEQQQLETQRIDPVLHMGIIISYFANILFFFAGFLGLKYEGKYYPRYVKKLFWIILLWVVFVYLKSGASILNPSVFMGVKGIAPYLGMIVIFTASPERFQEMRKTFFFVGIILVLGGLFNTAKLGLSFDRDSAQNQLLLITVNLVWVAPLILFYNFKKYKLIAAAIFSFSFLFSFLIVTRSFMILHLIVLLYFTRYVIKVKLIVLFGIASLSTIVFFLLPQVGVIQNATVLLDSRMGEDTRSWQILLFLATVDYNDFIYGSGVFSFWRMGNREYEWLDNQVLLTAWWAGVLPIFCYLVLLIKGVKKFLFKKKSNSIKRSEAFIVFLWILALLGFSIFITISSTLYHFLILFVLGSLLCKKKNQLVYEVY